MINFKKKYLYVHIPKTGGKSVEQLLFGQKPFNGSSNHRGLKTKLRKLKRRGFDKDDFFKFSFVRNPWDLIVSVFFYTKQDKKFSSLTDWLKQGIFNNGKYFLPPCMNRHWTTYLSGRWLLDNGEIGVDFIGKLENFQEDLDTVCDRIGVPRQKAPHLNKSKHKHYTEYYDDDSRDIIAKLYAKEIDYFKYEFD